MITCCKTFHGRSTSNGIVIITGRVGTSPRMWSVIRLLVVGTFTVHMTLRSTILLGTSMLRMTTSRVALTAVTRAVGVRGPRTSPSVSSSTTRSRTGRTTTFRTRSTRTVPRHTSRNSPSRSKHGRRAEVSTRCLSKLACTRTSPTSRARHEQDANLGFSNCTRVSGFLPHL